MFIIFSSCQGSVHIIPTPSVTSVVNWPSNLRGKILPQSLTLSLLTGHKIAQAWSSVEQVWAVCGKNLVNFSICSLKSTWHKITIMRWVYCFLVCYVFSNPTEPFCAHIKNASNTCSTKTYYINHPTHKKCKSVNPSSSSGQLTNELRYCSHSSVALMAADVTHNCFWHSEDKKGTRSKSEDNKCCLCQYNFSCNNGKRLVLSYSMCHLFRLWLSPSTHSYRIAFYAHNMNTRLQQW